MDEHLVADLRWDARKLRVVGKGRQVFHSLEERSRSNAAPVPVLLRKIPIQSLKQGDAVLISSRISARVPDVLTAPHVYVKKKWL